MILRLHLELEIDTRGGTVIVLEQQAEAVKRCPGECGGHPLTGRQKFCSFHCMTRSARRLNGGLHANTMVQTSPAR